MKLGHMMLFGAARRARRRNLMLIGSGISILSILGTAALIRYRQRR